MGIYSGHFHYTENNKVCNQRELPRNFLMFVILLMPHIYKRSEVIFKINFPFEDHIDAE